MWVTAAQPHAPLARHLSLHARPGTPGTWSGSPGFVPFRYLTCSRAAAFSVLAARHRGRADASHSHLCPDGHGFCFLTTYPTAPCFSCHFSRNGPFCFPCHTACTFKVARNPSQSNGRSISNGGDVRDLLAVPSFASQGTGFPVACKSARRAALTSVCPGPLVRPWPAVTLPAHSGH